MKTRRRPLAGRCQPSATSLSGRPFHRPGQPDHRDSRQPARV